MSFVILSRRGRLARAASLAIAALTFLGTSAIAPSVRADDGSTDRQLLDRIQVLQGQLDELKAQLKPDSKPQNDRTVPTQPDAAPASSTSISLAPERNTTDEVFDDASRHEQLLQLESLNAGWSQGRFLLQSSDGRYLLHPWFQLQFRNATTYREDEKKGDRDDLENGFEVRRMKFGFDGNAISTDLTYMLQFGVDRKSGNTQLEMAWAKYHLPNTPFSIRAGQFKDPVDHEQLLASKFFVAADRTITNDYFVNSEGFVKGASLVADFGTLRGEGAFTGGMKNYNTNFQDYPTNTADWGGSGRVEYKLFGDWKGYDAFSALDTKSNLLVVGGGVDWTEAGHTGSFVHVADATFKTRSGVELYGAYLGRYSRHLLVGKVNENTYDWTARAQASIVLDRRWEPFVQYEYINFDSKELAAGSTTDLHAIRVGVNYFLFGHNAKVTADVGYLPNGSPINDDGTGVLTDNHHNEIVARAQFQLLL